MVPSGSNRFHRPEPVFFYFEVYDSGAAPRVMRARLLDRATGALKWDSGLGKMNSAHQGGSIPLDVLAPGSYQLEIAVGNPDEHPIKRTANLEIK